MRQEVKFRAPIKVIESDNYYLVIEDAVGVTHYFHKEHDNKYGKFKQGEYDGWSKQIRSLNDNTKKCCGF
jgi:hypothetical protein